MTSADVEFARIFAIKAHGDQKYGEHLYGKHLADVVTILQQEYEPTKEQLAAAWLHDVLEDTDFDRVHLLEALFGTRVARLVRACTGFGLSRKERNASIYRRLPLEPDAIPVKIADRIANVEASKATNPGLLDMYQREYPEFRSALWSDDSRLAPLWMRLDTAMGWEEP